jgi:diguanylate cyclase (GGDEF)-like protein/PAS domain S-box-containing protein
MSIKRSREWRSAALAPQTTMAEAPPDVEGYRREISRLKKVIDVLMDRAERSTNVQVSDFSLFQSTVILEEQVRSRTRTLEAVLNEHQQTLANLRKSEARFRTIVNQSLLGIAIIEHGNFTYTNAKFEEIFGYTNDEMRLLSPLDLVAESDHALVKEVLRRCMVGKTSHVNYRAACRRKDERQIVVELEGGVLDIPGKRVLLTTAMDITERQRTEQDLKALQEQLREQSTHDALTGLYNRRFLEESMRETLYAADCGGGCVSVVLGDLDHFKTINDRHGHLAGDEVLRVFGALLKGHCRESDFVCRYGGEEFLLIFQSTTETMAVECAERLRIAIEDTTVTFGQAKISMTASFGVAEFPRDGTTDGELITAADQALYAAKAAGRNRVIGYSSFVRR